MLLPIDSTELSIWLAVVTIILLVTLELLSPYYGRTGIRVNRRRLRAVAFTLAIIFLGTVALRIYQIVVAGP